MPRYTFKLRSTAYITVEIDSDNYDDAESDAFVEARRADNSDWEVDTDDLLDVDNYEWEAEDETLAHDCFEEHPDGDYTCTHHRNGKFHVARGDDGSLLCAPWPIVEETDEDEEGDEDTRTPGCKATKKIGGLGYSCVHHRDGHHEATGSSPLVKWPIDEAAVTEGCRQLGTDPTGQHWSCTHHRNGMHVASYSEYPEAIRGYGDKPPHEWPIATPIPEITFYVVDELTPAKDSSPGKTLW